MEIRRRREADTGKAPAASSRDAMAQEEDEEAAACSLDVTSEDFDPLLALYSPTTPLPFPDVRCFNNLAEYESFLRGGGRARGRAPGAPKAEKKKGRKPAPDPERVERLKRLIVQPEGETEHKGPPRRSRRPPKNVLTRMPLHEGSPVGRLYRCIQERLKVNVHIRTFKGLRGVCSGFIVAFDKCWNMAMVDVDETYRKPVLGKAFYNEPQLTLTRLFDRLKLQESGDRSSTEAHSAASQRLEPPPTRTQRGGEDKSRSTSRERRKTSQQSRQDISDQTQRQKGAMPKRRTRRRKEKIDYQQVFTRHMKQVFIRGESVLLVHVPE
ncbi:U7 snRNA-associated Sm-like protein LSm11 [Hyla sarda]|uniref:U7 snRNA-associated Sm-like protein LSm11 n=1 Tax=Hyla sarda TaxID=327740 RepID=UPI0024C3D14F|nr:U7 snRNA-associated Sm-like protein LSm11 [Hyla sarda]